MTLMIDNMEECEVRAPNDGGRTRAVRPGVWLTRESASKARMGTAIINLMAQERPQHGRDGQVPKNGRTDGGRRALSRQSYSALGISPEAGVDVSWRDGRGPRALTGGQRLGWGCDLTEFMQRGSHPAGVGGICHWSDTQANVALASGEAEHGIGVDDSCDAHA